ILPILAAYEAKATFFLNGVGELSEEEEGMIHQIQRAGHDIQAHGEHHVAMNDYISNNGLSMYLEKEIDGQLAAFHKIGITPTVFAYPFGEKNRYIDLFLWTKFSATRNVALPKQDLATMDEIFY